MSPPLYKKSIYTLEEVKNIRVMAQCEEINIFFDYQKIIVNLCNTILEINEKKFGDSGEEDDNNSQENKK